MRAGTYANVSVQRKMKEDQLAKLQLVSCHEIAGIWVAFFQECQQSRCGQEHDAEALELAALQEDEELSLTIMSGGRLDQQPIQVRDFAHSLDSCLKPVQRLRTFLLRHLDLV